mgnify:CR=1 FL=1
MQAGSEGVATEVVEAEQSGEADATHLAAQCTLLCVKAVWEDALMTCQMQLCVFILVICFLENSYVIHAAFMQVSIFIAVERINLYADNLKVLAGLLAGFTDVMHVAHLAAFAGKNKNFLLAGGGDGLHFGSNLFAAQAGALNFIVTVEPQ